MRVAVRNTCPSPRSLRGLSPGASPSGERPCLRVRAVQDGLSIGRWAQTVERGLEDWFEVAGVAVNRGDGDDHVEDLFEREIVADLVSALRGGEERPAGSDYPGAVAGEERVAVVRVLEQLGGDVALAGREGEEPVQPSCEDRSGCLAVDGLGGLADGVDLVGVEGLEELLASGEVAVQSRHADSRAPRDLG